MKPLLSSPSRAGAVPSPAVVGFLAVLLVAAVAGCANRGMSQVTDATGGSGGAGTGGGDGTGGAGTGGGGTGGDVDAAPDVAEPSDVPGPSDLADARDATDVRDASADHACTPAALFTFEGGVSTVKLAAGQVAVKSIISNTTTHYCGTKSLELMTQFGAGTANHGEVQIPLTGAQQNVAGKTLTIHVAANPDATASTYVSVNLMRTTQGLLTLMPPIRMLTSDWSTASYPIPSDVDAGTMMVDGISLQVFDNNNYAGSILVDDLDIR